MVDRRNFSIRIFIFLLLLLCKVSLCNAKSDQQIFDYGLTFRSHSVNQDGRTSLELTPNKPLDFSSNGLEISFDLKLREELYTYGYVCRIISDDISSFDIISYLLEQKINFVFTNKDKIVQNIEVKDPSQIVENKWLHICIRFYHDHILVNINNKQYKTTQSFNSFKNIKIYFGLTQHNFFYTTDVPPMTIRNILIKNHKGKVLRQWDLMEHNKNEVFDKIKNDKANVKNGVWEIDKHSNWNKIKTFIIQTKNPQISYDNTLGRIFIAYGNTLLDYNVGTNKTDSVTTHNSTYHGVSSQLIYSPYTKQLISYHPDLKKLNFYDSLKNTWQDNVLTEIRFKQHHNRLIDKKENQLILFGGYGEHTYNAELCKISLTEPYKWSSISLDRIIYPRYLSGMGWEDEDNILIIGGHGSFSGKQEESPHNFYDLYSLNVRNNKVKKLWEINTQKRSFVFGNSLVVDKNDNKIYALTYNNTRFNTHIYLSEFEIATNKPAQYVMSDSITYDFLDINSYCDLFYYKKNSSLYSIVVQKRNTNSTSIDIYKLAFPPFHKEEVGFATTKISLIKYLLPIIFLFLVISVFIVVKKKKGRRHILFNSENKNNTLTDIIYTDETKPHSNFKPQPSSVSLLGEFQVIDKNGKDMTKDFTPTIKLLFIYLFLFSIKNGKGITSHHLDDIFWFHFEKSKAANNRNVNIRKLRLILEQIGEMNLSNKGSYWFLEIGNNLRCDYKEIFNRLFLLKTKEEMITRENISQIVIMASAGNLLPSVDAEWADEYKADYSSLITDVMLLATKNPEINKDNRLLLKIADVILISDIIEEDAIKIKCNVLYKSGQKGLSKQCFDKFCAEHKRLLNTLPNLKYEDIIY